jgi:transposase
LCRQLARLRVELVAIERPDGLLVERLLDARAAGDGVASQPGRRFARSRTSGGKSDRFDAFVLCELARTDSHRFRVLVPDSDQTKALRALTRGREDLVGTRTGLTNQLRAELERFWPGPLGLFTDLNNRISLAFLECYPSPADARGLATRAGWARRAWRRSWPGTILRPAEAPAAARQAQARSPGARRRARAEHPPPPARAHVGRDDQVAEHPDHRARAPARHGAARASRRPDLPLAMQGTVPRHHRRRTARGDRRPPRPLPGP